LKVYLPWNSVVLSISSAAVKTSSRHHKAIDCQQLALRETLLPTTSNREYSQHCKGFPGAAETMTREMSIEDSAKDGNAPYDNRLPLTTANLATHERATSTLINDLPMQRWLSSNDNERQRGIDVDAWIQLVERDQVAAAIEALIRVDAENKPGKTN
jgi:hypothetical protein